MFADRTDAGRQLAAALRPWAAAHPLVLGLPRGGVVVAAEVARALQADLDVVLVKKLRAPNEPELALGAVDEEGNASINLDVQRLTGASDKYLESERQVRVAEMTSQRARYRAVRPRVPVHGRTVLLVDDGLATGATMQAALQATRLAEPRETVVAVPVAPRQTLAAFDKFICLDTPADFRGVGQFYRDFRQTTDDEVVELLRAWAI